MNIGNPTLAHFSHFRHFSSLFTNLRAYKAPLYNCRESSTNRPFYAKQTQSQVRPNQRKPFYNKYICEIGHLVKLEKQTQSNPIQTQNKSNLQNTKNERKYLLYKSLSQKNRFQADNKQTQTNPISNPTCGELVEPISNPAPAAHLLSAPEQYEKDYRMAVIVREGKTGRIPPWMQNTGINRV
jgi:hypothetical protein